MENAAELSAGVLGGSGNAEQLQRHEQAIVFQQVPFLGFTSFFFSWFFFLVNRDCGFKIAWRVYGQPSAV